MNKGLYNRGLLKQIVVFLSEFIIGILFFSLGERGTQMFNDSESFIMWSRMPNKSMKYYAIYSGFLKICRYIFGENNYIEYIWIIQTILALVAVYVLTKYLSKEYKLKGIFELVCFTLLLIPYSFTLPEAVATHYIFTEGISISAFYFSFLCLMRVMNHISFMRIVVLVAFDIALIFIRPQFFIVFPTTVLVVLLRYVHDVYFNNNPKLWIVINVVTQIIIVSSLQIGLNIVSNSLYDNPVENQFVDALGGKIISTIDEDSVTFFSGEDAAITRDIYDFLKTNGTIMKDRPVSILNYEELHLILNTNTRYFEPVIWKYFSDNNIDTSHNEEYATKGRILSILLDRNRMTFYGIIVKLMPSSLVASIFFQPKSIRLLCYLIASFIYLVTIVFLVFLILNHVNIRYRYVLSSSIISIMINSLFL